ncbi:MAG: methyltransferase domain-containing protein [Halobacteria archaeon]|nr:methyltransferase domain-containing protein [Halobacteria archaeon]
MSHKFDPEKAEKLEDESRTELAPVDRLLELIEADGDDEVADIGCGTGFFTRRVADEVSEVYGIDVERQILEYYAERGVSENVSLIESEVGSLALKDGCLDSAFSITVLHEFYAEEAFEEIARTLREGGTAVIIDFKKVREDGGPPYDHRVSVNEAVEAFEKVGEFEKVESGEMGDRTYYVKATK